MKKIFFSIILVYLTISVLIIVIVKEKPNHEVRVLSLVKNYSRVLTKDEIIDIPVYISSDKSFFTLKDNITSANIESEKDESEISISNIRKTQTQERYENVTYTLYYFEINFKTVYTENLKLNFKNPTIHVVYNNDVSLDLRTGDISILFHNLKQENLIDFNRMYSINNQGFITGIYMELVNKTDEDIFIDSISLLNPSILVNMNAITIVNQGPDHLVEMETIIPNYKILIDEMPEDTNFILSKDMKVVLPINYFSTLTYIDRFPIIFSYSYQNENYEYIIDDYIFYESLTDLESSRYEKEPYQYTYS